jgi:sugar phosphate isomerase/epimerase
MIVDGGFVMKLGAQLYTVRDFTKTLEGISETLKKVADIGYTSVQLSGTCPFDADWVAARLEDNGLVCPVTHTNPDRLCAETGKVAAEHLRFGCKIAGLGAAPGVWEKTFSYETFRDRFLPVALALREKGMRLGYHNHGVEFAKTYGKTMLERLAVDFPVDSLAFILDTYWVQYGGGSPSAWLRRFAGQVTAVHFKDMIIRDNEQKMAAVGEGNIDFDTVISACEDAGTQYIMVEQDDCGGEDPFACLKRSYDYLRARGLE